METLDTVRNTLRVRGIKFRTRQTRWGETVTIPQDALSSCWIFAVAGGLGVTSNTDDPNKYVGPFPNAWEALAYAGAV